MEENSGRIVTWKRKESKEEFHLTDKESVVAFVRRLLQSGLYENSDFEVTNEYITVDLRYDSKAYVKSYVSQLKSRYPKNTKIRGTRVTVRFGER